MICFCFSFICLSELRVLIRMYWFIFYNGSTYSIAAPNHRFVSMHYRFHSNSSLTQMCTMHAPCRYGDVQCVNVMCVCKKSQCSVAVRGNAEHTHWFQPFCSVCVCECWSVRAKDKGDQELQDENVTQWTRDSESPTWTFREKYQQLNTFTSALQVCYTFMTCGSVLQKPSEASATAITWSN